MSNIRWDEISRATDTQLAVYTFHKRLVEMYNDHFPKIKIKRKCNKKNMVVWRSDKKCIKQKSKIYLKLGNLNFAAMVNYTNVIRENCGRSWKWLKNIIIVICVLSIVMLKNLGYHKKYCQQEPETPYSG